MSYVTWVLLNISMVLISGSLKTGRLVRRSALGCGASLWTTLDLYVDRSLVSALYSWLMRYSVSQKVSTYIRPIEL